MDKTAIVALVLVPISAISMYFAGRTDERRAGHEARTIIIDREAGTMALVDSDAGAQTISRLNGAPTNLYYDFAALIPAFRPDAQHVLMLGVGGGEMFRVLRRADYRGSLTGVDHAPDTETTLRTFDGAPSVLIFAQDALAFVDQFEPPFKYEGIIVDLYDGPKMSVEQATSALYYSIAHKLLTPHGVVLVNVAHREDVSRVVQAMHEGGLHDIYAMRAGADENTELLGMVVDDWSPNEPVRIPRNLASAVDHRWTP